MPRGSNSTSGALRTAVRVVVIGDRGTGKSSLISASASESFPENVPSVLPPTRLPADYYPDGVPVIIVDTSSRLLFGLYACVCERESLSMCVFVGRVRGFDDLVI